MQYHPLSSTSSHGSSSQVSNFTIEDNDTDTAPQSDCDDFFGHKDIVTQRHSSSTTWFTKAKLVWSSLTFSWMRPLLELGSKKPLESTDLGDLDHCDQAERVYELFSLSWQETINNNSPSLTWALIEAFGFPFIAAGVLKLLHDSCLFIGLTDDFIFSYVCSFQQYFYLYIRTCASESNNYLPQKP
jgi:hypothetical protein